MTMKGTNHHSLASLLRTGGGHCWLGWLVWLVPLAIISVIVAIDPFKRTVTQTYHEAVVHWWDRQPIYVGTRGMNYLPHFVPLFSLFALLPYALCDVLWRWAAVAGFGTGLWRFTGTLSGQNRNRDFALVSVLVMPLCLGALGNGQANAHFGASLLLAAWCLHERRWWWATGCLCLLVALKPLGISAVGLAMIAFPCLWWRLGLGLGLLAIFPYCFGPPEYVTQQYIAFARNLTECFAPSPRSFADINGLLRPFGFKLTGELSLVVRASAGVALIGACALAARLGYDLRRSLLWLGFSASYLMLFNPMTEANSYAILAPALALWAWRHARHGEIQTSRWLLAMILAMSLLSYVMRPWFQNDFTKTWHPAMALVFLGLLIREACRPGAENERPFQTSG